MFITCNFIQYISNSAPAETNTHDIQSQKTQLSFATFTDTHIGSRYQHPLYRTADYLDKLGKDLVDATNRLDFAIHLGDIVNRNTNQVNGNDLPWFANQYKNNLKAFLVSQINIPFFCVLGNHDINDYEKNSDDPHNLTRSLINELNMNNPVYAMMYDGILFLIVPELGCITWTHPVEYEWIEFMTNQYPDTTTIIFCHQAIEDTTLEDSSQPYRGKQDMDWWANLFMNNPQIKMWIHGHNHYLDWYIGNKSTGQTYPVRHFGHEIAFSAPYSQMDWSNNHEEDRIVIYNITSTNITSAAWENNGAGGHWVSGYDHTWNVPTTYDPTAENWYSFPMFLQDNETQLTDMKLLSPDITLQLVGTKPMELFFDEQLQSPSSKKSIQEVALGFGNDRTGKVHWTNPGIQIQGPTFLTFPEKYPYNDSFQEDGRSGPLYHSFPMGTICAAAPGQTYTFTITARCRSGNGRCTLNASCSDWGTRSHYSMLSDSDKQVFSYTFTTEYETISGAYTVPNNHNAWFLQGKLEFLDPFDYDVSLFSVKREQTSDTTDNFHVCLSNHWYNTTGVLARHKTVNFSINPKDLCCADGTMNFTTSITGNRYGMVNLVYREPLLMGMNACFRINEHHDDLFNISLTKTISQNSAAAMKLWDSQIFNYYPRITELSARFLMTGITGKILHILLDTMISKIPMTFKMIPFSTHPMYDQIVFAADDNSSKKYTSNNGNIWFTCNSLIHEKRNLEIILPNTK